MGDITNIIERVIAEHKVILADLKTLNRIGNDATALEAINKGKEAFMPGRLGIREGLNQLEDIRAKLDKGLLAHFHWEEITLLNAFQENKADSLIPVSENSNVRA
jgi:hypothetical protein